MDYKSVGFMDSTKEAIRVFQKGIHEIAENYPEISLERIRDYLQGHNTDMSDDLRQRVDSLEAIREKAISDEMFFLVAKARAAGKTVPEEYTSGKSLVPSLESEIYKISPDFQVFEAFSWYTPAEASQVTPGRF